MESDSTGARRTPQRRTRASRVAGYLIGAACNAVLLFLINASPGWQAVPFLTPATAQVVGAVNLALAVGLAVSLMLSIGDPPWLRAIGDLATTCFGLAAALVIWDVFPFSFHGSAAAWSTVFRVLLIIAIVGSCIAIVVDLVRFGLAIARPHRPSPSH